MPQPSRGFPNLPCLRCAETGTLQIRLADLEDDEAIVCTGCDAEFSLQEARYAIDQWADFLNWCDSAPIIQEETK